jgi:hypothetical protein
MAANSSVIAGKFPPRAPAPALARRIRVLVAAVLLLASGVQLAGQQGEAGQGEAGEAAAGQATDALATDALEARGAAAALPGTIEVLTVKPAKIAPAVLMPNAQVPGAPPPIDAAERAAWLAGQAVAAEGGDAAAQEGAGAGTPGTTTIVPSIVLGPATPSVAGRAYLVLTRPLTVHPETTVEFAADPAAMVGVRLKVRAGETYLLDFAVSGQGQGVYAIAADSGQREFDDPEGALGHLLIGLKAEASGWTTVRLQRSGAGYHLHSVEVSGAL